MPLFLLFLLIWAQISLSAVHWGLQQTSWPFPQSIPTHLKQNPLQSAQSAIAQSQMPMPSAPNEQAGEYLSKLTENYNSYLSKLSENYNDYYSEYTSRYNEYLAKYSEYLRNSMSGSSQPSSSSGSWPMPPDSNVPANGLLAGPSMLKNAFFHRHRAACPPKAFPNNNKTDEPSNKDKAGSEPKYAHPLVLPIIHGNFTARINPGTEGNLSTLDPFKQHLAMHSSVTLVVDHDLDGNKHVILVDTGLALLKQALINGMLSNGIQPHQVDTICISHPDTDTMGNLNVFPCAEVHSGNAISRENLFARQTPPLFEGNRSDLPFRRLFAHSELYLTPGMSFQDQSLVVRNVPGHGTVAIVGKLILNEGDLANNLALREFAQEDSEHRKLWQATRREILCMADYIVPGYGVPFKVSPEVKILAECSVPKKSSTFNNAFSRFAAAWRKKSA